MSRKRSSNGSQGQLRPNTGTYGDFKGFIDLPLSESVKDELLVLYQTGKFDFDGFLAEVVDAGYKFSLVYNSGLRSYIATLTGRSGTGENENCAMSGFGSHLHEALLALYGKHVLVARWGTWRDEAGNAQLELPAMR